MNNKLNEHIERANEVRHPLTMDRLFSDCPDNDDQDKGWYAGERAFITIDVETEDSVIHSCIILEAE